ncbi:MAG TPA: hypothetical protein DGB72_12540 [Gemmatimonadetes bacterium]|jgi:hypothetical protein|nr:hypothetical protein [Gemmatimonadota bacterium]
MEVLDQALDAVRTFHPLTVPQREALLSRTMAAAAHGEFEPFKTSSIFDSTAKHPDWLGEEPQSLREMMPT